MSRSSRIISLVVVLLMSVSMCAYCKDASIKINPMQGYDNYSGGAMLISTLLSIFPCFDRKPPKPSPTSQWVKSYVRCDGNRIPGYWVECDNRDSGTESMSNALQPGNSRETICRKDHPEGPILLYIPISLQSVTSKVYGKLSKKEDYPSIYKIPDSSVVNNAKPVEDGQTFWRRVLLEKHNVIPPAKTDISVLISVEGELDKAVKSGVDFKLPDGWSKVSNEQVK